MQYNKPYEQKLVQHSWALAFDFYSVPWRSAPSEWCNNLVTHRKLTWTCDSFKPASFRDVTDVVTDCLTTSTNGTWLHLLKQDNFWLFQLTGNLNSDFLASVDVMTERLGCNGNMVILITGLFPYQVLTPHNWRTLHPNVHLVKLNSITKDIDLYGGFITSWM